MSTSICSFHIASSAAYAILPVLQWPLTPISPDLRRFLRRTATLLITATPHPRRGSIWWTTGTAYGAAILPAHAAQSVLKALTLRLAYSCLEDTFWDTHKMKRRWRS